MKNMNEKKHARLQTQDYAVDFKRARRHAQFHLYAAVASRARGFHRWESAKMPLRPKVIYDLSGLPLFYDFPVRVGKKHAGVIRAAANKVLGDTVISAQVNAIGWDMRLAQSALKKLLRRKYRRHTAKSIRLVCYSYPKLALEAVLHAPGGKSGRVLMDVADFSVVSLEPPTTEASGQVASSVLGYIPDRQEKQRVSNWDKIDRGLLDLIKKKRMLDPERIAKAPNIERLKVIDRAFTKIELIPLYKERIIDFCCHGNDCQNHECFCLHPQENNVHCTRASSQMVLCYWRYCCSQHDVAQAFGVDDTDLTPWNSVASGLNDLTHDCFEATLNYSVNWGDCTTEINNRRPFLSDTGGHTRACAGYQQWNYWFAGQPRPRYLYIFDPWPANVGAISWENFNTSPYAWIGTLVRKTTSHT